MAEQAVILKQMIEDKLSFEDKEARNEIYRIRIEFADSDSKKDETEQT